jgi:hypothetical protein
LAKTINEQHPCQVFMTELFAKPAKMVRGPEQFGKFFRALPAFSGPGFAYPLQRWVTVSLLKETVKRMEQQPGYTARRGPLFLHAFLHCATSEFSQVYAGFGSHILVDAEPNPIGDLEES